VFYQLHSLYGVDIFENSTSDLTAQNGFKYPLKR